MKNIELNDKVLLNTHTGESFQINDIGKSILNRLKSGKTDKEIIKDLSTEYKKDINTVYIDFYDFKEKLKLYGLIQ